MSLSATPALNGALNQSTQNLVDVTATQTPKPGEVSEQNKGILAQQAAQIEQQYLMNSKMGELADMGLYLSTLESAKRQNFAMLMQNLLSALDTINKMAKRGYDNAKGYIS
jgi:hypothetical protein